MFFYSMDINGKLFSKVIYELETFHLHVQSVVLCVFNRQLLIFPKGNNVDQFSIYLHVAYSSVLPHGWTRYAQFSLSVVDQVNGQHTVLKGSLLLQISNRNSFQYACKPC